MKHIKKIAKIFAKKNNSTELFAILIVFTLLLTTGCSVDVTISSDKSGNATISYASKMGNSFSSLIRSIFEVSETPGTPETQKELFDKDEIQTWLIQEGLENVKCSTNTDGDFNAQGNFSIKQGFLASPKLIEQNGQTLKLTLSPNTFNELLANMPEYFRNYPDLLMAPVLTGEPMTQTEYTDLIASVYGKSIANELNTSYFNITLEAPNKKQTIKIPLMQILMLQDEQVYSIQL